MANFNLNEFKSGKNAINGLGQVVKFICETRNQLFVAVQGKFGDWTTTKVNLDGKKYSGVDTNYDLIKMVA